MLAKEVYDKSEKQVLQLEREWYAGRYLSKCYGCINLFIKKL